MSAATAAWSAACSAAARYSRAALVAATKVASASAASRAARSARSAAASAWAAARSASRVAVWKHIEPLKKSGVEIESTAKGYRLVLEGRFAAFPDGRSIHCRAETPDQRPLCIAAAQLDRVAFEDADTGSVISEWRKD